jgi:mRNA-degrading endonuclease RelE of RelBE toxin-antitoxin system
MKYSVKLTPNFKKEAKRLSKKYNSLKTEFEELFNPFYALGVLPTLRT